MSNRLCRYNCGTMLGEWHDDVKKYLEADSKEVHDRERCESLKKKDEKLTNGHNEISLELVLKKLTSIGVTIDLKKLANVE